MVFSTNGATTMGTRVQKNKVGPFLALHTKINSKWITGLNVRAKTINVLEENIGINLHYLELCQVFLDNTKNIHYK